MDPVYTVSAPAIVVVVVTMAIPEVVVIIFFEVDFIVVVAAATCCTAVATNTANTSWHTGIISQAGQTSRKKANKEQDAPLEQRA